MTADTMPGTLAPAGQSVADRVMAQLKGDYPPGALSWVQDIAWTKPTQVPLSQIDWTAGHADWDAAAANKAKIQQMRTRISGGFRKPVIAIRPSGSRLLYIVDGHSRTLSYKALGMPVTAYIGTAKTPTGPWLKLHSQQL